MIRNLATATAGAAMVIAAPAAAQEAAGYWAGTLELSADLKLRVGVQISRDDAGALAGTLDSPDQDAFNIPLAAIEAEGGTLKFTVPAIGASFEGNWDEARSFWTGTFQQGPAALPLSLVPGTPFTAEPLPAQWTMPDDAGIAELIDERIALREGAGMVIGVIEPSGTRIVARGPSNAPAFDGDTLFEIGSVTKVFTALLLADMALDGTVALDDPVAKYLPEGATMPTRSGKDITLRQLSMQNSGLPRLPDNMPFGDPDDPYADYTEQHLLDFLAGHELRRDPGAEYEYSNLGIGLLGYALARAAGTDYESLLRQRILDPLEMNDTGIALSPDQQGRLATPHDMYMRPVKPWALPALAGAGALRSDTSDMLQFLAAALDPDSPIGPAMALTLSERLDAAGSDNQTALGWMITTPPTGEVVLHGGGTGGFRSFAALQRETGRAVVGLTNAAVEPSAQDITLHVLFGSPKANALPVPPAPPPPQAREAVSLTPAQLDHVTGTYQMAPEFLIEVRREGERLMAQLTGQPPFEIFPEASLEFFWKVVDAQIRFTEEDGVVTGAVFSQDGRTAEIDKVG